MSTYDLNNVGIIVNGHGDWFTARLIRLIAKADLHNREKLRKGFPDVVEAYEKEVVLRRAGRTYRPGDPAR